MCDYAFGPRGEYEGQAGDQRARDDLIACCPLGLGSARVEETASVSMMYRKSGGHMLMLVFACMVTQGTAIDPGRQANGSTAAQSTKWDAMVEALVNSNPQPELVRVGHETLPLFAPGYDWKEQDRVWKAFVTLSQEESTALWEQLLKHVGDGRYALTMRNNSPVARNYTVGILCRMIATERLSFAENWNSEEDSHEKPDVHLNLGIGDIGRWRANRAQKSLYELQIELCERALSEVAIEQDLPEPARRRIRKQLRAWIDQLQRTQRPLFLGIARGGFELLNADQARRARAKFEQANGKPARRID